MAESVFSNIRVRGTLAVVGVASFLSGIAGNMIFSDRAPVITGTGTSNTQIVYSQEARTALSNTGGLATYNVFSYASPLTTTGAIQEFCLEVVTPTPHATMTVDCGVVGDSDTGTGTSLFNNETLSEGLHCIVPSTTEVVFGPTQRIKCASLSGTGGGLSAEGYTRFRETVLD